MYEGDVFKHVTDEAQYDNNKISQNSKVNMYDPEIMHLDGLVAKDGGNKDLQEEEALNFLDCNASSALLLPRDEMTRMMSPSLNLMMCGGNMQKEEHTNSHRGKGKEIINNSNLQAEASTSYEQVDVNVSPWANQLYQTGNEMLDLDQLFLPAFTP